MENNTDIIVLTSIVIVLFIVFIIATARELNSISTTNYVEKEEGGPRAEMMRFIGKLFSDDRIDADKKMEIMKAVNPIIEELLNKEEIDKK